MLIQDPWEEQLQGQEGGKPLWGVLSKLLGSLLTGGALTSIGEGGAGGVSAQQASPNTWEMTAPGAGGEQVSGAVRMPWQAQEQETVSSFSGFFEKLNNPQSTSVFSQFVRALLGRK